MRRLVLAGLVLLGVIVASAIGVRSGPPPARAGSTSHLTPLQQRLLSGAASTFLDERAAKQALGAAEALDDFTPTSATGCPVNRGSDVRVNQECLNLTDPDLSGRGQAQNETSIAQDPYHRNRVVGSMNDYRRGDGNCYGYVSDDAARSWHDSTVPMSFTRGDAFGAARQYWQAGGDTSVDFDTKGNAYLSCQVFNRGLAASSNPDQSSAFYVFRTSGATLQQHGASWTFPGRPVSEFADL